MRMVVVALTTGVSTLVMRSTLTYAPCGSAQPLTVRRARASQSQSHTAGLWLSAVLAAVPAAVLVLMVRGWCLRTHGSVMPSRG